MFVFSVQYSEKALYNQLCFYKFIFDWEYAVSKVGDEKGKDLTNIVFHKLLSNFTK